MSKLHCRFFVLLSALLAMTAACSPSHAFGITITAPANNAANLTCSVMVTATVTRGANEDYAGEGVTLRVSTGTQWLDFPMDLVAGETDNYQSTLGTNYHLKNGNHSMVARVGWMSTAAYPPAQNTAYSAAVGINTNNGWFIVQETAKTYAKVNAPTNGTKVTLNSVFTVNTDHKVTWKRREVCGIYTNVPYRFKQTTSNNAANMANSDGVTDLPTNLEEHGVIGTLVRTWLANGNIGFHTADAYSYFPGDKDDIANGRTNQAAHGFTQFEIEPFG